jgi:hypothetical protein
MSGDDSAKLLLADVEKHLGLLAELYHELLRFRHFKRYYFSLAFDWERLEEIIKRARRVHPKLLTNMKAFKTYIEGLLLE